MCGMGRTGRLYACKEDGVVPRPRDYCHGFGQRLSADRGGVSLKFISCTNRRAWLIRLFVGSTKFIPSHGKSGGREILDEVSESRV